MITRHRNLATIGLAGWILPFVALLVLALFRDRLAGVDLFPVQAFEVILWGVLVFETLCFLGAGYHLAKAKGYSSALVGFGLFPCFQPVILTVLLVLPDKNPEPGQHRNKPSSQRPAESVIGRVVRYRRNALVGNIFGLLFVLVGISIIYFPIGVFEDFENETLFGFLIFVCGYTGVMWGCRWWLKAKGWPDALIFIGLLPLTLCLIPYVWEIFIFEPDLLPLSMFLMTLILLVVVLTLPNRSGIGRRRRKSSLPR
jgi:hypothetical protein